MGRPKGSPNKNKAPTSELPVTTKHNEAAARADLTEDQQRALLATWVPKYEKAKELKNQHAAELIKLCKAMKADGVELADVKTWITLQTPEGEAKLKAKMEAEARVARWVGSAIGTQFGLFEDDVTSEDKSFEAGKRAGLAGETAKAPGQYDTNEWLRGWQTGQAALLHRNLKQKQEDADEFDAAEAGTLTSAEVVH